MTRADWQNSEKYRMCRSGAGQWRMLAISKQIAALWVLPIRTNVQLSGNFDWIENRPEGPIAIQRLILTDL